MLPKTLCRSTPLTSGDLIPDAWIAEAEGQLPRVAPSHRKFLELKRTILANLPSDYKGFNQYWKNNQPAVYGWRRSQVDSARDDAASIAR